MLRFLMAIVVGTLVFYGWGMAAWMALPIHDGTLHRLPNEAAIVQALQAADLKDGYYTYPYMPETAGDVAADEKKAAFDAFEKQHRAGPFVSVIYHAAGGPPMPPEMLTRGLVIDVVAITLACLVLVLAGPVGFLRRWLIVILTGCLAALVSHVALWNWMYFPLDFVVGMVLDLVLGWTLAGLFLAAILGKKAAPAT